MIWMILERTRKYVFVNAFRKYPSTVKLILYLFFNKLVNHCFFCHRISPKLVWLIYIRSTVDINFSILHVSLIICFFIGLNYSVLICFTSNYRLWWSTITSEYFVFHGLDILPSSFYFTRISSGRALPACIT